MRVTLKKYIFSISNRLGLAGIVWLSAAWTCFILSIGALVNPLHIRAETGSLAVFIQTGGGSPWIQARRIPFTFISYPARKSMNPKPLLRA